MKNHNKYINCYYESKIENPCNDLQKHNYFIAKTGICMKCYNSIKNQNL